MQAELLAAAREAALAAAEVHRRHLGRVAADAWTEKGVADFVTHVDREAEACIVAAIRERFPLHGILAEEETAGSGLRGRPDSEFLWIIDPLDGTTNFLHGYPMYAVSIAVVRGDELLAGVVHGTATGGQWYATAGGGAFLNGNPIHVSQSGNMARALIGTGFPFKVLGRMDEYLMQFRAVLGASAGVRRAGAAALDLCHVASGYFDGFWELSLAPWDFAAGTLIIREAGGVVSAVDGELDVRASGSVLAGNPLIHDALQQLLRDAPAAAELSGG
jgi:myo-inositol-1(or 4)-monophosphatase